MSTGKENEPTGTPPADPATELPETETTEQDGAGAGDGGLTLASVNAKVDKILDWLKGGTGRAPARDEVADVASQVRAEVDKIKAAEGRTRRNNELAERLQRVEDALAKVPEHTPRQMRKVEAFMGWGDPA